MQSKRTRRSTTLIAAVVAGAFLLPVQAATADTATEPGAAPAKTTAADTTPEQTVKMKIGISKKELADLRAKGKKAEGAGQTSLPVPNPSRVQKTPSTPRAAKPQAQPLTAVQAERTARQTAAANFQAQAQDASPKAAAAAEADRGYVPIEDEPNQGRLNACFDGDSAGKGIGRIYNRFTYCARINLEAEYWEIDSKGVPVEKEGTTTAVWKVFGQGDAKDRRVRIWSQIEKDSVDYDWGPWDNIFTAPNVGLSLMASCSQDLDVCGASPSSYTMPWATWDNNPIWADWDITNSDRNTEGRDKISYNQWYVEAWTDDEEYKTLQKGTTAQRLVRCDSGTYFNQGKVKYPKACIFYEVTPHLTYTRGSSSTHSEVAEHLDLALNHPNSTYPLLAAPNQPWPRNKIIPGKYQPSKPDAPGLHRITAKLHPDEIKANRDHKNGACFKTGPKRDLYLDTGLPNGTDPGEQCDEFPFASTLEGAGSTTWDFSVKSVDATDNRVAGGMLRKYYTDDRILAWDKGLDRPDVTNDRFYMEIL